MTRGKHPDLTTGYIAYIYIQLLIKPGSLLIQRVKTCKIYLLLIVVLHAAGKPGIYR